MFRGSIVALVTPFKKRKVDYKALQKLVDFHVKSGTHAILPCGTTGESATLSMEEHADVIEAVVSAAAGRIPVIAGTGANNTKEAIELTKHAKKAGADGSLQVCPYYNKPTQEGLYRHFKTIAEEVDIPIILYNIPSRTGVNMSVETIQRLSEIKNIVAIKEASGNLSQMAEIKRVCKDKLTLLSGDDALTLPVLSVGGEGVISVVANIVPEKVVQLINAWNNREIERARDIYLDLLPLVKAMFIETNPIPVKTAMGLMGMISPELRLPLCEMGKENLDKLRKVLRSYGLVK